MSRLTWDGVGERLFETGVDHGVLYTMDNAGAYEKGVAWNGLINVTEKPSGGEATPLWADNIKYLNLYSKEEFAASIEAYYYPDEFAKCNGEVELATGVTIGQQPRVGFGLVYRTKLGNDVVGDSYGYKLHIIYGAKAAPAEKAHATVNDSPEAMTMSWELTTTPVSVEGHEPIAHIVIDSTKVAEEKLTALENKLFGDTSSEPTLPTPAEIAELVGTQG